MHRPPQNPSEGRADLVAVGARRRFLHDVAAHAEQVRYFAHVGARAREGELDRRVADGPDCAVQALDLLRALSELGADGVRAAIVASIAVRGAWSDSGRFQEIQTGPECFARQHPMGPRPLRPTLRCPVESNPTRTD